MIRKILVIYNQILTFKDKAKYKEEKNLAYMESDQFDAYHQYVWLVDDKRMIIDYKWARLFVEDRLEDLFYKETVEEKYKKIVREQLIDYYNDENLDGYKSMTINFKHCNYTTLHCIPNPLFDTDTYNKFWQIY